MPSQASPLPQPKRGEIWFVKFPSDPPEKNPRPVVIVSMDARNQHPRAETVLAVPLSMRLRESPTHIRDRMSTRLNSSHRTISYAVFCLKKKKKVGGRSLRQRDVPQDCDRRQASLVG